MTMILTSSSFEIDGQIPSKHTCDGENINPELSIHHIPVGTQSLALIMEDPDVPKHIREDGLWVHWVVFNMPPSTAVIVEGDEPVGKHGKGTAGNTKYFGPCPPDGEHRYFFKIFALDKVLDLETGISKEELFASMEGHILEQAELVGRYKRHV